MWIVLFVCCHRLPNRLDNSVDDLNELRSFRSRMKVAEISRNKLANYRQKDYLYEASDSSSLSAPTGGSSELYTLLFLNSKPPFLFNAAFSHNTKIRAELQGLEHTSLFKLFQNFLVLLILFKLETGKS